MSSDTASTPTSPYRRAFRMRVKLAPDASKHQLLLRTPAWLPLNAKPRRSTFDHPPVASSQPTLSIQTLRGSILPGGGEWEIVRDHDGDQQTAHLNTRYNLLTHDGATIYLQTTGTRTGKKEVLEKLGEDESIGADQYRMRLQLTMETGDEGYSWVNQGVSVASSGRNGDQVIYDAYQLL
ncbi:hypothetical protein LTR09_012356 [Extremus antarcticus]|uniref:Uncharacterized protein n=1 Tax=Extremus antarcticus TaxID=702011 RepID=A0AAJ0D563_9PEZI|nr:hypothetical protein LTR09_012356 [Extremus antarcticus]